MTTINMEFFVRKHYQQRQRQSDTPSRDLERALRWVTPGV